MAVFTFQGAKISVEAIQGNGCSIDYTSEETPMELFMNLHLALENKRNEAIKNETYGPKVLVLGQGRTTLSKILLNYAVRSERKPLWADIDIMNGSLLFPGTLSSLVLNKVIDPENGVSLTSPISYFYGNVGNSQGLPVENPKLYKLLMNNLSQSIHSLLDNDESVKTSGLLVTFLAWSDHPLCMEMLEVALDTFKIDTILVVGSERLYSDLNKKFESLERNVLKIPKSGGVVEKNASYRKQERTKSIRRYFYGSNDEYSPFPLTLSFKDLHLRRVGEGPIAPNSALPIGATRKVEETRLVKVEIQQTFSSFKPSLLPNTVYVSGHSLVHLIMGVSMAEAGQETDVLTMGVLGYVHVTDVDESKGRIALLSPCHGKLPKPYLLFGTLRHLES